MTFAWQLTTTLVIALTPMTVALYDLIAYWVSGNGATLSRVSLQTSWEYPPFKWAFCLLFGELLAHLFTARDGERPVPMAVALPVLVLVPFLAVLATLFLGLRAPDSALKDFCHRNQVPVVIFFTVAGIVLGAKFLAQTRTAETGGPTDDGQVDVQRVRGDGGRADVRPTREGPPDADGRRVPGRELGAGRVPRFGLRARTLLDRRPGR